MTDTVNVGFARSELLKKEWDSLRNEINALEPGAKDATDRREAIQHRMNQITTEMAAVLTQTRKAVPTPDIDDDDDEDGTPDAKRHSKPGNEVAGGCRSPLIQYSARNLHIVQRTYDSTDSEEEEEERPGGGIVILDDDELQPQLPEERDFVVQQDSRDSDQLRRSMMLAGTSNDTVITVEGRPQSEKGFRGGFGGLGHLIKDKLKEMHSPTAGALTEEDRERLTLEQSRLEREARKLKRLPERSRQEQRRLDEITARIVKISNKLGNGNNAASSDSTSQASNGRPSQDVSESSVNNSVATGSPRDNGATLRMLKGRKSVIFAHSRQGKDDKQNAMQEAAPTENNQSGNVDEDMSFEVAEEFSPISGKEITSTKSSTSKRKKGWMALEAGVASLRAFGRNIRGGGAASNVKPEGSSGRDHLSNADSTPDKTPRGAATNGGGNAFEEAVERVAKRGEKLHGAAEGSEQMANDANDMLDAVRALRQRNQKGGFFS